MGGCRRCFNKWSPLNPYIHKTDQTLVFNQSCAVYFAEIIRDVLINQRIFLLKNSIYLLCEKVEYKLNSLPYPGKIIDTALRYGAIIVGPVPLPTEIKKYTVNRSAFVYKNAREQFEMRVHKRLIDIINPSPKIIESLTNMSLPSGVNIDVKML